ncbi:pyruvate dehydrogenase complex dihydrolipoamide acetyltransferase [Maribacter sp. PR1]|uniref:Acetyltransferase component of pyruvate dehydrogenase complex n=1 Tax=Maribacter cobaltidurans TaxID=1178778 RepID=A0ABU7IZ58_9FLAO|nr:MULTISPECIES: pyruvate dehydrogenase complex dihydrolipoamide acetyltransferase [Maribacter]MDC6390679.1 pyruvate dehydrogenase complex dihydrolipoamide acetyltransferase [Maribacter sp. PR1]MEE1978071.1 pyruvate dehydrogenase complex dihydrolipoamide acetyltransferase [Maribacter cobaltidurans]
MAEIINMPRLSDTMEEGTVAKWLKNVGDKVEEGDILAEIETDKATMEFESFHEGTLLHIGIKEGDGAPVDTLLAIIGEEGEDISGMLNGEGDSQEKKEETTEEESSDSSSDEVEESAGGEIPEGVEIVKMPRLSDTMEEGTVASWLKQVGDDVEEGDILAEIETDKATMEFESFYSGKLLYIGIQEGESSPVDAVLAVIGPEGTDVDAVLNSKPKESNKSSDSETKKEEAPKQKETEDKSSTDSKSVTSDGNRIFASPLAKKIAEDKGIDLSKVSGTGDNGRIIKKDIENFKPEEAPKAVAQTDKAAATAPAVSMAIPSGEEGVEETKNSNMRKAIAKALGNSKFAAPHFYLTIEVDMDNAIASRAQINSLPDIKVSFNDMVLKACAMALRKHPQVNTTWNGDTTKQYTHIHMGVAVAVDEGLVVPVVKHADLLGLTQIGAAVKDLAGKARSKKIAPSEMEGSTFTVSNLGMFGIQEFTSIINQPNSAILSVGAIVEKPVVKNGEIVVGNTMKLTLACDHRTVDGAVGAQFLQTLRYFVENPVTMLA